MPRPATTAAGATIVAAVVGNSLISKDDLAWLSGLRRPRMQLPLAGFAAVGIAYYVMVPRMAGHGGRSPMITVSARSPTDPVGFRAQPMISTPGTGRERGRW